MILWFQTYTSTILLHIVTLTFKGGTILILKSNNLSTILNTNLTLYDPIVKNDKADFWNILDFFNIISRMV